MTVIRFSSLIKLATLRLKDTKAMLCDALQTWIDFSTDLLTELVIKWTEQALSNAIGMNRTSSATRCRHESEDNSWSLDWVSQRTEQALLHACSRHERNKLCYMHVVDTFDSESATKARTKQALLHACSRHESEVSLLQKRVRYWSRCWVNHSIVSLLERHSKWVCYNDIKTQFSNESSTCTFYDLSLFTTLMTTAKMICTADRVAYTICLERIEHILYVWKHKDMS